jgi:ketosteroid isomerase-like protein
MSREKVEIVRRAIVAGFAQPPDVETMREVLSPTTLLTTDWGVDRTEHHGVQGFLDALADMAAAWDSWHQDVERIIDAGQDRVVVLLRFSAQGKESGVPVQFPYAMVISMSVGRIAATRVFIARDEALKAVGLI